jgi:hypothetical protein
MTRSVWCVLLLATGVTLADDTSKPKRPAGSPSGTPVQAQTPAQAQAQTPAPAPATEAPRPSDEAKPKADPKAKDGPDLGMSILGNQEAPKALVIVPWKQSEMGDAHGISTLLDDSRLPIDREVFMRLLSYYEIRSNTTLHNGAPAAGSKAAPAETNAAQPAAAHRRKS